MNQALKGEIKKNVLAMFNHNIGAVVVNGTDNVLISKFAGLVNVGLYSNYYLILSGISSIVSKVSEAVTASVGNMGVAENDDKIYSIYRTMNMVNFWIYSFCTICFWMLFQPFIIMWLGEAYLLETPVVLIVCINFYISGMRKINITFRDAMGLFWHDRYKPVAEAIINLVVSICLAKKMGITGVFIGTFVSNMMTGFWVEPFILYKYKFKRNLCAYMWSYLFYTCLMVIGGGIVTILMDYIVVQGWSGIVIRLFCCVIVINLLYLAAFWRTGEFQHLRQFVYPQVKGLLKKI